MASNDKVYYRSPIGFLELVGSADRLKSVRFVDTADPPLVGLSLTSIFEASGRFLNSTWRLTALSFSSESGGS